MIYELHVGTFSAEGTFDSADRCTWPRWPSSGVTAIELMPVGEFPGDRGWGYDGVYSRPPSRPTAGPKAFARLVNAAHRVGLAVILDVVYNHVGASGSEALAAFGPYFTDKYQTPWGDALNFDDAGCDPVRAWVRQSAVGWIRDFHVDGLRLDAMPRHPRREPHTCRGRGRPRRVHAGTTRRHGDRGERDERPRVIRPPTREAGASTPQWADDFHHALRDAADR